MNTSNNKTELLIEEYRSQLIQNRQLLKKSQSKNAELNAQIQAEIKALQQKLKQNSESIAEHSRTFENSLNPEFYSPRIINLTQLSNYLREEKSHLAEVVSEAEQIPVESISKEQQIHTMLNRSRFETQLLKLKEALLSEEIQYLTKNVMINKAKSSKHNSKKNPENYSFIYDDIPSVSKREEEELNQKISTQIEELERLTMLNFFSKGQKADSKNQKVNYLLIEQRKRLDRVEQSLSEELKKLEKLRDLREGRQNNDGLNEWLLSEENKFEKQLSDLEQIQNNESQGEQTYQKQVEIICNAKVSAQEGNKIVTFRRPYEELNDKLTILRKKVKNLKV